MTSPPVPYLDANCHFPWRGVKGCKGKDARAMLRLTVSHDNEQRDRINASRGWYETVQRDYAAGTSPK